MRIDIFPNGCGVSSLDDLDYNKIASESLKIDLIDWCKGDREKWLRTSVNDVYDNLYLPTRKERFESLPKDVKNEYIEKNKVFGINMDTIKSNALIRYAMARVKYYGTKENFISKHGDFALERYFPEDSKASISWEKAEELINNGFV